MSTPLVCMVDGCQASPRARGLCNPHYKRASRRGTLPFYRRPTLSERIWSKVRIADDVTSCWPWAGAKSDQGYGLLRVGGVAIGAHRLAYADAIGPIPEHQHVLHRCDNRPCCNPSHLFVGTNADNVADKVSKGRAQGTVGEKNRHAKLSAEQVGQVRTLYGNGGISQTTIAAMFGVRQTQVSRIVRREEWAHI